MDFDWKSVVKTVAPGIATALGGPLAGLAVKALGDAVGMDAPTEEKLQAALSGATPDDLLKIKQAEQDFQAKMKQLDIDLVKISADDRDSARQREIAVKDNTPRILAGIIVTGYIAVQWYLLTQVVVDDMREIVMRALGTLDACVTMVLAYYFGSSAGSERKTQMLAGK